MPDVGSSPVLVWVAVGIGVLTLLAQAVPKILGPLGGMAAEREARDRTRRADLVSQLRADLSVLEKRVETIRTESEQRERDLASENTRLVRRVVALERWAFAAQVDAARAGITLPALPPEETEEDRP